jgi:hypothetical protein
MIRCDGGPAKLAEAEEMFGSCAELEVHIRFRRQPFQTSSEGDEIGVAGEDGGFERTDGKAVEEVQGVGGGIAIDDDGVVDCSGVGEQEVVILDREVHILK